MTTLLRVLIDRRGLREFGAFQAFYLTSAKHLAKDAGEPRLASTTISQDTFRRWYAGETTPQTSARRILSHMFDRPIEELIQEVDLEQMESRIGALHINAPDNPTRHNVDIPTMEGRVQMAARRAIEFAIRSESKDLGPETMSYLQEEVRRIAKLYTRVPIGQIIDDLTELQDMTFRLLDSGRGRLSQVRDLFELAAIEAGMLAKASHDLGDPHSAMTQARSAVVSAERAEHQAMVAWVRGLQSLISYWADRHQDALDYARLGAALSKDLRGTVSVWLASLEGRAAALLGDHETAQASVHRAVELRERTEADEVDKLGGNFEFPPARQLYYAAETSVLLGRAETRLAEEAVREFDDHDAPHWAFGDEAGARADLALARLNANEVEGVPDAVAPILALPPAQRNAGIVESVQRVRRELLREPVRSATSAGRLRDEITAFSRHRPLALPR
ncbi:hypothetical protein [Actinomadura sp. DC4]|uniref:hypothetical protein n=1 Tax=Actinomadura sp. DC4 TaxID=3055069 RepID=UPI0025B22B7E|nr:hypothetical protein [Actinomadura sp. DC4]MDN3360131.1 hypothetical protein [Actinomadura sp. DC4]